MFSRILAFNEENFGSTSVQAAQVHRVTALLHLYGEKDEELAEREAKEELGRALEIYKQVEGEEGEHYLQIMQEMETYL